MRVIFSIYIDFDNNDFEEDHDYQKNIKKKMNLKKIIIF